MKMVSEKFITDIRDIPEKVPLSIFGSGKQGTKLAILIKKYKSTVRIISFIDDRLAGGRIEGISVQKLECLSPRPEYVIIPSGISSEAMKNKVKAAKLKCLCIHPGMDLCHKYFPFEYEERKREIEKVISLFHEHEDSLFFRKLVENRIFRANAPEPLHEISVYPLGGVQYMDYINSERVRFAIEGGIGVGATTLSFINAWHNLIWIDGFDPLDQEYRNSPYRGRIEASGKCAVMNTGLWEHSGEGLFYQHPKHGCSMVFEKFARHPEDYAQISVVSIDDFIEKSGHGLDMIKLDVEGAELQVLKGASHTIRNFHPYLVISIYHSNSDMTDIPLWIDENFPEYSFHLGHYSDDFAETILYAEVKEN